MLSQGSDRQVKEMFVSDTGGATHPATHFLHITSTTLAVLPTSIVTYLLQDAARLLHTKSYSVTISAPGKAVRSNEVMFDSKFRPEFTRTTDKS